jgi:hypothetical protein
MNSWYKISLICGFTPLILGILIFFSWVVTEAPWLQLVGIINIIAGFCLFIVGIFCLGIYLYKAKKIKVRGYFKRSLFSLLILLINYPVAASAIYTANYIMSTSTVIIENYSSFEITQFRLTEREDIYQIEPIRPKGKTEKKYHFKYEGSVYYTFLLNGKKYKGLMFGYVSSGIKITSVMVISENGEVNVNQKI